MDFAGLQIDVDYLKFADLNDLMKTEKEQYAREEEEFAHTNVR